MKNFRSNVSGFKYFRVVSELSRIVSGATSGAFIANKCKCTGMARVNSAHMPLSGRGAGRSPLRPYIYIVPEDDIRLDGNVLYKTVFPFCWLRSLSTCGQCDFVLEPPRHPEPARDVERPLKPCLGLDKLIREERENQEWNVAFQKALVKRLEASERRITLDDYLDDDDDDDDRPRRSRSKGSRKSKKSKKKREKSTSAKPGTKTEKVAASFPDKQDVFGEKKCECSGKIRREEQKRKTFVKIMEREQIKFEKRSIRAQKKYEKERQKAYAKCEHTQLAMEKGYFKKNKDGIVDKAEETFSVFIHMDPAECDCHGVANRAAKCKRCFFIFCVWFYIIGFIIFGVTTYVLTWL